jgi:GntR family transcriptional repressor for pyruvate dehydrogenase complex
MLKQIKRTKVYKAAIEQIKAEIENGRWVAGTQLPSERELATQMGIGRPAVREAIRVLETLGYVEIRIGQGSFVREKRPEKDGVSILESMLREDIHVVELLEVREMIEPQIAYLAAQSVTNKDIQHLEAILKRMRKAIAEGKTGSGENIEFHLALTRAVGNKVLLQIHELLLHQSRESVERFLHVPGRVDKSMEGHQKILDSLRNGNSQEAQQVMLAHLRARYAKPTSEIGESEKPEKKKA